MILSAVCLCGRVELGLAVSWVHFLEIFNSAHRRADKLILEAARNRLAYLAKRGLDI